jgi:hypothetical protein
MELIFHKTVTYFEVLILPFLRSSDSTLSCPSERIWLLSLGGKISLSDRTFPLNKLFYLVSQTFIAAQACINLAIYFICTVIIWQASKTQFQGTCCVSQLSVTVTNYLSKTT